MAVTKNKWVSYEEWCKEDSVEDVDQEMENNNEEVQNNNEEQQDTNSGEDTLRLMSQVSKNQFNRPAMESIAKFVSNPPQLISFYCGLLYTKLI